MGRDRGGLSEGQGGVIRRFRKASPPGAPSGANNLITWPIGVTVINYSADLNPVSSG